MKYCKDCWSFGTCKAHGRTVDFTVDDGVCRHFEQILQQTNADRFRAMSDEEQQKCVRRFWEIEDFADWLQQPV